MKARNICAAVLAVAMGLMAGGADKPAAKAGADAKAAPGIFTGPWEKTSKDGIGKGEITAEGNLRVTALNATREAPANVAAIRPFAVKAGAKLDVHYTFHAKDLQEGSEARKKEGLGYAEGHLALVFYNAAGKVCGRIPIAKFVKAQEEPKEVRGCHGLGSATPKELVAPEGAVRGVVSLKFNCCDVNLKPELVIEGIELTSDEKK